MTALGKLLRTTAFKLTLVYLAIFVLFAASLLGYFALNTRRLIDEQITSTVDGEISGLSEQYEQGGIRRLVIVVDLRSRRPGSSLYLVTTPTGEGLAGNVGSLEPGVLDHPGLAGNQLSAARIPGRQRSSRIGPRRPAARRLSSFGRTRSRGTRAPVRHHRARRAMVAGTGHRAWACRRILRQPPRAQAHRRHDRYGADHHARRSRRTSAGRRHRRRTRPARRSPQCHARAHRGPDAGPQGSIRQHRP